MSMQPEPASLLDGVLQAEVLARASDLFVRYRAAKPFRHVVIDNFLEPGFCNRLLAEFPEFDESHALGELGFVQGKATREAVGALSGGYIRFDEALDSREFLDLMSEVTGVANLLFDPEYVGGGTHENRHGQNLAAHIDFNYHPRNRLHRRLNLIVYLNPEWKQEWGGALELHSDPWEPERDEIVSIEPLFNRAVIFETTEHSWHGFPEIRLPVERRDTSRKSFALYLYSKERPLEETASTHSTIYIPDGLPRDWQTGRVLAQDDIDDMQRRFLRIRRRLKYLYGRERTLLEQVETLEAGLVEARETAGFQLQGYARAAGPSQGIWPDGWASRQVDVTFVPSRPVIAFTLAAWVPAAMSEGQSIEVRIGDLASVQALATDAVTRLRIPVEIAPGTTTRVRLVAVASWIPSEGGSSSDERALAYHVQEMALEHA